MDAVTAHEREIADYALERLDGRPGPARLRPPRSPTRLGPVSFELDGIHAHDVSEILDRHGVAVRAGHHCAQPLMDRLGVAATARASFGVYTTRRGDRPAGRGPRRTPAAYSASELPGYLGLDMDELYREKILDHYKRPQNFGRPDEFDLEFEDTNPFCGDEQHVFIKLDDDGRVAAVAFEGKGCAISTAATSMLTEELERQEPRGAPAAAKEFVLDLLGIDISATRMKCALLGLKVVKSAGARRRRRLGGRGRARQTRPRPPSSSSYRRTADESATWPGRRRRSRPGGTFSSAPLSDGEVGA